MLKQSFINENKLAKLISNSGRHIVNLKDDSFQYCNGYILANCTYDLDIVIQKLFRSGAITNYKKWEPKESKELKEAIECEGEIEAVLTPYLKSLPYSRNVSNIFKAGDKFISYNKEYVDLFKDVQYKVSNNSFTPNLRVYGNGKLIGVIMPVREEHGLLYEIVGDSNNAD